MTKVASFMTGLSHLCSKMSRRKSPNSIGKDFLFYNIYSVEDPRYFKEDEVSYILEMFEKSHKELKRAHMVEPFHKKASQTHASIMSEINLGN